MKEKHGKNLISIVCHRDEKDFTITLWYLAELKLQKVKSYLQKNITQEQHWLNGMQTYAQE